MNVLVAYSHFSSYVNTTREYLESFQQIKGARVKYANVVKSNDSFSNLSQFDVVILSYCARLCIPNYLDEKFLEALKKFKGIKVACIQDEYDNVNYEADRLAMIGVDLILTCVPSEFWRYVYPEDKLPDVKFKQVLTGYVSENKPDLKKMGSRSQRPILIGYRGRKLPVKYGYLGHLKFDIGVKVKEYAFSKKVLNIDIEWTEEKRIYGADWEKWLQSVLVTLVTESGSNVFDFDGRIALETRKAEASGNEVPPEIKDLINQREAEVCMNQISPRVFEAISNGCNIIAFEGSYSQRMFPWKHYIPLKKDYSNIEEVFDVLKDHKALDEMFERSYVDIVLNDENSYAGFAKVVQDELALLQKERGRDWSLAKDATLNKARFYTSDPQVYRQPLLLRLRAYIVKQIARSPFLYWFLRYAWHYCFRPKQFTQRMYERRTGINLQKELE